MSDTSTGNQNQNQDQQVQQGIKDLSSGVASALKAAGYPDTQLIQALGTVAAAAAAFVVGTGGVGGLVVAAVGFVGTVMSLFQSSGSSDQFQQVQQALKTLSNKLADIEQGDAANAIDQRVRDIQKALAPAQSAEGSLNTYVHQLPLSNDLVDTTLGNLLGVLGTLAPPDLSTRGCGYGGSQISGGYWQVPAAYQVFWSDSDSPDLTWPNQIQPPGLFGYGSQAPSRDSGGNVFNYMYVLPAFLYAVSVFISVGAVIDPKFKENWTESVIKPSACFLRSLHDFLVKELVYLTPGQWNGQILSSWLPPDPGQLSFSEQTFGQWGGFNLKGVFPVLTNARYISLGGSKGEVEGQVAGISIEYGVVEKYSGYNSVGIYTLTPPFSLQSFDFAPYNKFQIRLQKRLKDVYIGTGLAAVWNMINELNKLASDPPLPGPSLAVWSMRQVAGLAAGLSPSTPDLGSVSLVALSRFLENTLPIDTPPPPSGPSFTENYISMRTLLEPRPHT